MKKYQYLFTALLAIAACQKNEVAPETIDEEPVWGYITAEISTTAVKGVLVDGEDANTLDFKWEVGDKIRMAVNKGTLETPIYAYRNGYIYSVNDGEHTVTIKYDKGTGENIANYIVGAWYPWLDKENSEPKAIRTTQDYSIGKVSIPLHATNVSTENPIDVGTSAGTDVELSQKLVFGPYNPGGTAFSVLGFRLKGAERTIKSIKVNNGSQDYTLTNINTPLTDDVQYFYIVLPASDTPLSNFKATITANDGENDLEYTRTKSSYTPTAGKVTRFPVISDINDTGRYTWIFKGEDGPSGNKLSQNAPFTYWFPFYGSPAAAHHSDITRGADHWTETPNVSVGKNNFYFAITANIDGQGRSSSEWGSVAESKTTINGAANQVMRFPIHTGNYPILGFKVTKLDLLGTGMKVRLDVNSTQDTSSPGTNTYVGRYMPVRYTGATENRHQTLSEDGEAGTGIYYIDLSASNVQFKNGTNANETLPNSRTLHFTTFNLQFRDIVPGTSGTMDIYWIGFFNSKKELETFAAAN